MKRVFLALGLISSLLSSVVGGEAYLGAQGFMEGPDSLSGGQQDALVLGPNTIYLGPVKLDAYGPGIHADATGRPFLWQPVGPPALGTEGMPPSGPDPTLRVTPNKYGLGVHADQYGRIVQPVCLFGEVC
jgi:hypothetical protein